MRRLLYKLYFPQNVFFTTTDTSISRADIINKLSSHIKKPILHHDRQIISVNIVYYGYNGKVT